MALLLLNLGAGALADHHGGTSAYNSAAYTAHDTTGSTCSPAAFAALDRSRSEGVAANRVPILVEFAAGTADAEATLAGIVGDGAVAFSATVFQAFVGSVSIAGTFSNAVKEANNITNVTVVSNGAKLSVAVHAILAGKSAVRVITDAAAGTQHSHALVYHSGGAVASLSAIENNYAYPTGETEEFPDCLVGVSPSANLTAAIAAATTTAVSAGVTLYQFDAAQTSPHDYVYFLGLLANEPNVDFVEPVIEADTLSSSSVSAQVVLSFSPGDPRYTAQGFGVSGQCEYMHDREYDGSGEVVAIIGA